MLVSAGGGVAITAGGATARPHTRLPADGGGGGGGEGGEVAAGGGEGAGEGGEGGEGGGDGDGADGGGDGAHEPHALLLAPYHLMRAGPERLASLLALLREVRVSW